MWKWWILGSNDVNYIELNDRLKSDVFTVITKWENEIHHLDIVFYLLCMFMIFYGSRCEKGERIPFCEYDTVDDVKTMNYCKREVQFEVEGKLIVLSSLLCNAALRNVRWQIIIGLLSTRMNWD